MPNSKLPRLSEAPEIAEVVSAGCAGSYGENVTPVLVQRVKDAESGGALAVVVVKSGYGFV